jgi:metal-responsive CopG/Arc/MetJ family transcriptional regulator
MADNDPPVTFSLRLPAELAEKLDKMASEQKRSRSNLVRHLLTKAVK